MMTRTAILALAVLATTPALATEIAIKPRAVPQGTLVRLGDVAEIAAEDSREFERLAALPLMPAPKPGHQRFLRQREIQDMVAVHGEDMGRLKFRGEPTVEVESPVGTVVQTSHQSTAPLSRFRAAWTGQPATVDERNSSAPSTTAASPVLTAAQTEELHAELERLFVEYLERMSGRKANWHVAFEVPSAKLAQLASATSVLTCMGGNTPWTGKQRFVVTFTTANGLGRVPLHVDVVGMQGAVVAIRQIERDQIVTAADIEIQEFENVPVSTVKRAPLTSVESLLGMQAARAIPAGEIVMSDDLRPQLLVKRGEQISVYARGGGIQVRTLARAKQDGARGDLITVESLGAKKPFQAVVVANREAVVFVGNAAPSDDAVAERPFRRSR